VRVHFEIKSMSEGPTVFTEIRSGSKAGSYLRLIDVVYHSNLGLRVITKKREGNDHLQRSHESAGQGRKSAAPPAARIPPCEERQSLLKL